MTRHMMFVVDVDGKTRFDNFDNETSYDRIREALNGGWLEGVGGEDWFAYVDEEGKIKGLPVNLPATRLARSLGWPAGDVLCGPVVFVGPADEEGYDTGVRSVVISTYDNLHQDPYGV